MLILILLLQKWMPKLGPCVMRSRCTLAKRGLIAGERSLDEVWYEEVWLRHSGDNAGLTAMVGAGDQSDKGVKPLPLPPFDKYAGLPHIQSSLRPHLMHHIYLYCNTR